MALIIKDRVKEGTTSTGTGSVSLVSTSATFDTFASVMTNGDTTYYAIVHTSSGVDEWEVGLGTWNTGNTLSRTTVLAGSAGTSAVNFSAGTKDVFMTYPSAIAAYTDGSGDLSSLIGLGNHTTTDLAEGSNLYFNTGRIDSHLSGGTGVTYNAGAISIGQAVATSSDVTFNTVTLGGNPATALQAATKEYVDTIAASGIHYHERVRVEAAANRPATYNNGTSGVGATLTNSGTQEVLVIDGVTVDVADRVLITQQTNTAHNGVYTVTNVGSASTNWVLTRSTDADSYGPSDKDALGEGDAYFVKEGLTGAGELYVMNTSGVITFGTTPITFTVIAETAIYSAGTGLTLTGTEFATAQDIAATASPTFVTVNANLSGNVTGNVTGNVSGTSGSTTGNAATATKLATARTVQLSGDVTGSASFDGSANINIVATVGDDSHAHIISNVDGLQAALDAKADDSTTITAGTGLTGGGTLGVNSTLSLDTTYTDTRYVNATGDTMTGALTATGFTGPLTGNASTATALQTARTIGGVSFNGSANINLPGVNTAGTQSTSGNAATATALQTARTINGVSFNGSANITVADSTKLPTAGGTMTGQIISTLANSTATGGGQIYLNGATGNRIDFNLNGVAAPTFTTRSAGTKIVLYPSVAAASADFALGIESSTLWSSVNNTSSQFKWYGGTTLAMTLTGTGALSATTFAGNGASLTSLNGSNISSGTVAAARVATLNQNTTGNAATATALQTARTISLTGDVTGTSAAFNGSGNVSIAATIAANSVALGTDTTGNYVAAGAVSGVGLSGSSATEGGTFTVTSNATIVNSPNTIVSRDGSGNFNAGTITATAFSGSGASLTALNGSNITTGTVAAARVATLNQNTTGSAATLTTARTINGVSFNGSANITIADSTKAPTASPTFTGTVSSPTFNATSTTNGGFQGIDADTITTPSFTWTSDLNTGMWHAGADAIGFTTAGVNRITINNSGISGAGAGLTGLNGSNISSGTVAAARVATLNQSTTGNAATATALQTARTINGVSFNGTANITVADSTKAPIASPTFTGVVTSPTFKASGWTSAGRPTPVEGMIGYNTTLNAYEIYNGNWQTLYAEPNSATAYLVQHLIVAGGGGGGSRVGGGGGGGGVLNGYTGVTIGTSYTITIGGGGATGANSAGSNGFVGANSSAFSLTAIGGGNGMGLNGGAITTGGSGGGSAYTSAGYGSGTAGQGYAGGVAWVSSASYGGGGGGGAGMVGNHGLAIHGGNGGSGMQSSITGSYEFYAGGGGGGITSANGIGGHGGSGGGGKATLGAVGTAGLANTGGGGGGGADQKIGAAGGSGIVVIAYAGIQRGTGGTVSSSYGHTIHKFTSSGTFVA
jgi:hypothetical protein